MQAQRVRMDVSATNLANARSNYGGPYQRRRVFFETMLNDAVAGGANNFRGIGVQVAEISLDDKTPFNVIFEPENPLADEQGYVYFPNVSAEIEMLDMMDASRAYEANAAAFRMTREMMQRAIELGRV
jgi:flagellar basal-body rod protein FlgC